ncbi:hypothetical protein ACCT30_06045 [Rhizobium ruizarguesonis]
MVNGVEFGACAARAHFQRPRPVTQPMAIRLALLRAAAVLIDVDASSSSQFKALGFGIARQFLGRRGVDQQKRSGR